MVRDNDHKAVKDYEGSVNLRDDNQATPLMWALYSSDSKMVRLLLKKGADPYLKGWIYENNLEVKSNPEEVIYGSCLAIAAGKGKKDMLKYFVKKLDISPNDREINLEGNIENGWTALHWATYVGDKGAIKFLVKEGANINAVMPTNFNQTALHLAIINSNTEIVELLLESGADVNTTDWMGRSVLSYAFQTKSREMVKLLLNKGAVFDEREQRVLEDELYKNFKIDKAADL
jgi:ankyrin repeat protein